MNSSSHTRRAVAEINFGEGQAATFQIGNRSIHQFWHLFSSHFRHVLLAPQRRPDSGRVAWTWREEPESRPVTTIELAEVRRRLSEASRSLNGGFSDRDRDGDDTTNSAAALEAQVRTNVTDLVGQLLAQRDSALARFVCRTDAGLMLHSWGGDVAAEPYYPDANNGEITGTLITGHERPAGVSVVLETAQGSLVTRVQSESDGSFRFPNIAPGNYRVRVADRSDFSSDGLLITMERESITGLELRGVATAISQEADAPSSSLSDKPPWYRRRLTHVLSLLLLLVGVGSCVWSSVRQTAGKNAAASVSTGWQSASGQLAGGKSTDAPSDNHKVGTNGAWSSLTASRPLKSTPLHETHRSSVTTGDRDRAQPEPSDSALTGAPLQEGQPFAPDSVEKGKLRSRPASSDKPVEPALRPLERPGKTSSLPNEPESSDGGDAPKAVDGKLSESQSGALGKKRPASPGASPSSVDEASANTEASAASNALAETATASAPVKGRTPVHPVSSSTTANSAPAASSAVQSNANPETQSTAADSADASATDQLKPVAGRNAKERTGNASAKSDGAETIESSAAIAETEAEADLAGKESAPTKNKPPRPLQQKSGAGPTQGQPDLSPRSTTENSDKASDLPATGTAQNHQPLKPSSATVSKAPDKANATAAGSVSLENEGRSLIRVGRVHASAWKTRLVQDSILPTHPMTESEEEAVDLMRTKLLEERATQMPETFREGRVTNGFAVEFNVASAGDGGLPQWRDGSGAEPIGATVRGNQAELSWPASSILRAGKFILGYADGREVAQISVDDAGVPTLRVSVGTRARYWIGVDRGETDRAVSNSSPQTKFVWRLLSGGPMPSSWTMDENWLGGKGQRVDIPLGSSGVRAGDYGIALVDETTGWALASNVTFD